MTKQEIEYWIRRQGWITTTGNPRLAAVARREVVGKRLVRLFPGIYAAPDHRADPVIAMRAVQSYSPAAVLTGRAAAHLTLWPQDPSRLFPLEVASPTHWRPGGDLFRWTRRRIDPEWIRDGGGLRCTVPELTAVDLIPEAGGSFLDSALRTLGPQRQDEFLAAARWAHAAHPSRPGNTLRSRILHESRAKPWSEAERRLHVLLWEEGIVGWRANYHVRCRGRSYLLDVALPELKVAYEVDGYEFHSSRPAFEADRDRRNDLSVDGWQILHFTWRMITENPERVRELLRDSAKTVQQIPRGPVEMWSD
ncbi:DUF559 domain-containing protein [Granulicoccus phenolivorans]|uniref:DUF559 domain-containing protein n=1 Tax=Granulicoccus phenolivorans TaxID=266854 RepID=UPI00042307AE|nr:DUF559 domain-containing protein [Granulicoccus phenolivorans]